MKKLILVSIVATAGLGGCASMPSDETMACIQPNRRVEVEVGGIKVKPPPKPKPGAKPGKPGRDLVLTKTLVQGNSAWDFGSADLKPGGKAELDKLVKTINEGAGRDKRPTNVSSIIITGHTDRFEAESGPANLGDMRAQAASNYLASKGLNAKLMFWESKGAKQPMPVTKFCES